MDGFEGVTDLLCKSALKKDSPKEVGLHFAPGFGTGLLGTEGLHIVCFSISLCCHFITENINLLQILGNVIFMITGLKSLFAH